MLEGVAPGSAVGSDRRRAARAELSGARHHAIRGAAHEQALDQPADDTPPRPSRKPAAEQSERGTIRLDEGRRGSRAAPGTGIERVGWIFLFTAAAYRPARAGNAAGLIGRCFAADRPPVPPLPRRPNLLGRPHLPAVMTDSGSGTVARAFASTCRELGLRHLRPWTPQTNGRAERCIQRLLREWAACEAPHPLLSHHNRQRPHSAVGDSPSPAESGALGDERPWTRQPARGGRPSHVRRRSAVVVSTRLGRDPRSRASRPRSRCTPPAAASPPAAGARYFTCTGCSFVSLWPAPSVTVRRTL